MLAEAIIWKTKKIVKPDFKKLWKMFPVLTGLRTLYCKQLIGTTSFKNTQTKCKCNIFHNINCKSNINYLSTTNYLCKSQLVGKSRGTFDIYLKSDKKMLKDASTREADKNFTLPGHKFNTNAKFILIENLVNRANIPTLKKD